MVTEDHIHYQNGACNMSFEKYFSPGYHNKLGKTISHNIKNCTSKKKIKSPQLWDFPVHLTIPSTSYIRCTCLHVSNIKQTILVFKTAFMKRFKTMWYRHHAHILEEYALF